MNDFMVMANEVLESLGEDDINDHLSKFSEEKGLNKHEQQRLVEEVNVGHFLKKLGEGTQHEDFPLAKPIVTHSDGDSPILTNDGLNKNASSKLVVTSDMFMLDMGTDLNKVASDLQGEFSSSDFDCSIQEKWDNQELEKIATVERYDDEMHNSIAILSRDSHIEKLARELNSSEGMTKTAVVLLSEENEPYANDILNSSKFNTEDISCADAEPLSKEASRHIGILLKKDSSLVKDTKDALNGAGKLINYPFKHPLATIAAAGPAYYLASGRLDRTDNDRLDMSMKGYRDGTI